MENQYQHEFLNNHGAKKFQNWCKQNQKVSCFRDKKFIFVKTQDPEINLQQYVHQLLEQFLQEQRPQQQIINSFNQNFNTFQMAPDITQKLTEQLLDLLQKYFQNSHDLQFQNFQLLVFDHFSDDKSQRQEILQQNPIFKNLIDAKNSQRKELKKQQQNSQKDAAEEEIKNSGKKQNSDKKSNSGSKNKRTKSNEMAIEKDHVCHIKINHQRNQCENLHQLEYNFNALEFFLKSQTRRNVLNLKELQGHIHQNGFKFIEERWKKFLKTVMAQFYDSGKKTYNFYEQKRNLRKIQKQIQSQFQQQQQYLNKN